MSKKWNDHGRTTASAVKHGAEAIANRFFVSVNCVSTHTVRATANAATILGEAAVAVIFIGLQMLSSAANAQTYFKCVQPSGKVEFSDRACTASSQGTLVRHHTNSLDSSEARQQYQLGAQRQEAEQKRNATQKRTQVAAPVQGVCPSEQAVRFIEGKANNITLTDEDREFLQAEGRRARACDVRTSRYTADDWSRLDYEHSSVNRIDPKDREAGRARAEAIHFRAASESVKARMIADKEIEAREDAVRAATPSTITSCDPGGCWDNLGGRYSRSAGGNFFRNDGKFCQSIGGMLRCN